MASSSRISVFFLVAATACSEGPIRVDASLPPRPDAGVPDASTGTTVFDPPALAARIAEANCAFRERCAPGRLASIGQDGPACIVAETATARDYLDSVARAVEVGRVDFEAATFDGCMQVQTNAPCSEGPPPSRCNYLVGSGAADMPCYINQECGSGLYCAIGGPGACGVCQRQAPAGGACQIDSQCEGSAVCRLFDGSTVCVPRDGILGSECGTVESGLCRGALACVQTEAGAFCRLPAAEDTQCHPTNAGSANCDMFNELTCVDGRCERFEWRAIGDSCGGLSFCNQLSYCVDGTCAALPTADAPCYDQRCAPGHLCNGASICEALRDEGAACLTSFQCLDNLVCVGARCVQETWRDCLPAPVPDAGVLDATVDGGFDAGPADAGISIDGGLPDVGLPDAGAPIDAGEDAGIIVPFVPETVAAAVADGECGFFERCSPATMSRQGWDRNTCTAERTATHRLELELLAEATAEGRTSYDAVVLTDCLDALQTADCHAGVEAGRCDIFSGSRVNGQSCSLNDECENDNAYCSSMSSRACGACTPAGIVGASCAFAPCGRETVCRQTRNGPICLPIGGELGNTCNPFEEGGCRGKLTCALDGSLVEYRCVRPAGLGASCVSKTCDDDLGLVCGVSGFCEQRTWGTEDVMCDGSLALCAAGHFCNAITFTCTPLPSGGQPCIVGLCAPDAYCSGGNICITKGAVAGTCTLDNHCRPGLVCEPPAGAGGFGSCREASYELCQ